MASRGSASFEQHFQDLPDPRVERTRKHPLINIVFMAVCGVLSGSDSIAGIHEFAIDRRSWFARYLDLTNGVPSEDTFGRVLARIDPAAFEKCLLSWIQAVQERPTIAWSPSTARRCAVRTITRGAGRPFTWSRPGPPRTSCRWARSSSGEVQRDHGDSGTARDSGDLRGLDHDRRDGLPERDRRPDSRGRRRLRPGRQAESAKAL